MSKKTYEYALARVPGSVSVTLSLVTIALTAIITPQIILRAFTIGTATPALFVAFAVGAVVFTLTCVAVNGVTRLAPRRSTHQLAARYIGSWAGILVGAARIMLNGLLVLLGVELLVTSLNAVVALGSRDKILAAVLALFLAVPTLFGRIGSGLRWPRVVSFIGTLGLVAFLGFGLIQELRGAIDLVDVVLARNDAFNSGGVEAIRISVFESLLGACFPAAIVFSVSERVLASASRRRVPMRRMLTVFIPMFILIAVTMYFAVLLQLPGRRLGLPALSIAYALLGGYAQLVLAVLFALTGLSVGIAAYRQSPRVLRELAIDGLLPRRLAAEDAIVPRRIMILLVALVLATISFFLDSTRSLAMLFIVIAFLIGLVLSISMIARSRSILNDSTDGEERKLAQHTQWAFRGYGLIMIAGIVLIMLVQLVWFVTAILSLAVPVIFLVVHRKGLGKLHEALESESLGQGRILPTRVHSFVLVERLDLPTLKALDWARANRASSVCGLCVDVDPARTRKLRKDWNERKLPVALTVVGTPAGALRGPVIEFVRAFRRTHPNDVVMVYYSRVISTGWWERFFVRHTTPSIISELELEPGVMVTQVPYRIESAEKDGDDE